MAAPNPNPSSVTDLMWQFWLDFKALEPTVELGGIYAAKPGYHNKRKNLPPGDYSVQLALDKQGPDDKAAAIDLTFPDAQSSRYATIDKYASRLLASGVDPDDPRGNYLREFYGQTDGDTQVEGWDFQRLVNVTSDSSHLWHIHLSFLRAHIGNAEAYRAILSILRGETYREFISAAVKPPVKPPGGAGMFRLIEPDRKQRAVYPESLSPTGFAYAPVTVGVHDWMLDAGGIGTANAGPDLPNLPRHPMATKDWRAEVFGPSAAQVRELLLNDLTAKVLKALPPASVGGLTVEQVAAAVRSELDQPRQVTSTIHTAS